MLSVTEVSKSFKHLIFSDVNLSINPGNIVFLAGSNGTGKTTFLRLLSGAIYPDKGKISWNQAPIHTVRKNIGFCFSSDGGFYPRLSAIENFYFSAALYNISKNEVDKKIQDINLFEINYWNRPIEELSLGMRQKLKIIRSFLHSPELILFDEPLNALDNQSREKFQNYLKFWVNESPRVAMIAQHGIKWENQLWEFKNKALVQS